MPPCWKDNWITTKEGNRVNIGKNCGKEVAIIAAILIAAAVSGGVVVAAAIAAEVSGLSGTATAEQSAATGSRAGQGSPAARSRAIRDAISRGQSLARQGRYADAWKRFSLRQVGQAIRRDLRCAVYSTGKIRDFFLREPCRSMTQRLEVLSDAQGNLAVVSIAWVRMYSVESAIRLEDLAGTKDEGWVVPLSGELVGRHDLQFRGEHRDVFQVGSVVRFSDTVPVSGLADSEVLSGLSWVATEFPEP